MIVQRFLAIITTIMAATACPVSYAEAPANYWSVNYTGLDFTAANGEVISANGGLLKLGREFTNFFAIEIHGGQVKEGQSNAFGDQFEYRHTAAFGRINLPFNRFNVYLMGGAARVNLDTGLISDNDDFKAAGIGFDFFGSERTAFVLEYITYENDEEVTTDFINVGVKYHFDYAKFR